MSRDKRPEDADPDATIVHRPAGPEPDATVVHRPAAPAVAPDPDATVVHRVVAAEEADADATVMHRPAPDDAFDADATAVHQAPATGPSDADAIALPPATPAAESDADATVMHRPVPAAEPDPDATVMHRPAPADEPAVAEALASTATAAIPAATQSDPRADVDFDPEATVAVPTPGRRVVAPAERAVADVTPIAAPSTSVPVPSPGAGLNPLVAAANPLLSAVPQFRWTVAHPDPAGLRRTLIERLAGFSAAAGATGAAADVVEVARASLCALIDEAVRSTPWGSASDWTTENLTRLTYGAATDGTDFFDRLEALEADPDSDLDLLELMSICLALGFEGRFRDAPNGRIALSQARDRVAALVRTRRDRAETLPLSVNWRGVQTVKAALPRALALWVTLSLCALLLGGTYFLYAALLSEAAQPVFANLARLKAKPVTLPPAEKPALAPAPVTRLSTLLLPQVKAGLIEVREDARSSTVTLNATELFASGSATVLERHGETIRGVAAALNAVAGPVTVTGHTDSRPIRTARFPSNWELSRARAESVVQLMREVVTQPGRLRAEGVADAEPVAPNDTEANRRRNRRVVFILEMQP